MQLVECVKALALCHNVTPVMEGGWEGDEEKVIFQREDVPQKNISYQASSPDEASQTCLVSLVPRPP